MTQLEEFKIEFAATLPKFRAQIKAVNQALENCGHASIKAAATVKAFQVEWERCGDLT